MKLSYCVFNKTSQAFLGLNVTRSASPLSRLRDLFGRFDFNSGEGIWVVDSKGLHVIGALHTMDLIYLDSACRVIHIIEHCRPFRLGLLRLNCASVLQMPCHTIYTSHTQPGDQLLICPPEEIELNTQAASAVPETFAPRKMGGRS